MILEKITEIGWQLVSNREDPNGDIVTHFKMTQKMGGTAFRTYHMKMLDKKGPGFTRVQIYNILRREEDDCINESKMLYFNGKLDSEDELRVVTDIVLRT